MSLSDQSIQRGATFYGGTPADAAAHADILGKEYIFNDDVPTTDGTAIPRKRTGSYVHCRLVQNVSGGAILPKQVCQMKNNGTTDPTDMVGRILQVAPTTWDGALCYPADEFLPAAGVANNDFFLIVVEGPAMVTTDSAGTTTFNPGDYVIPGAGTAGRVVAEDITVGAGEETFEEIHGELGYALLPVAAPSTDVLIYVTRK